ncbi:hypothetical protein NKG94_45465 [Micromonospora sp. M12]
MTALWNVTRRVAVVSVALIVGLTAAYAPSHAADDETRTTVTDEPGAPGTMLQRFEDLTGQPAGDLEKVLALDAGGRDLTVDQLDALIAGEGVDGVKVLGAMPGSRDILGTTMADLADGVFDGKGGTGAPALLFASSVPDGREWCLTMCVARGKSIWECLRMRRLADQILTLGLTGDTTVGGTKAALRRPTASPSTDRTSWRR